MKIILRAFLNENLQEIIKKDSKLSAAIDLRKWVYEFESNSDIFNHYLNVTRNEPIISLNPYMEFDGFDNDQATHFVIEACEPSVVIKETKRDRKLNNQELNRTPFILTGEKNRIRLLKNLHFSKITFRDNAIGCSELYPEFFMTSNIEKIFTAEGMSGFRTVPIYKTQDDCIYSNLFQLYSESIMPEASRDLSWKKLSRAVEGYDIFRVLGCLTYDTDLSGALDFNRSAEGYVEWSLPFWIVSKKVKECYEKNRFKGWAFRPILCKGTKQYKDYLALWNRFYEIASINPKIYIR